MTIAARPQGLSDVAAGRLDRDDLDGQFPRPASAAEPPRGAGSRRSAAISASTRRASRPARPRSTSRCSSARSPPTTARARRRRSSTQHLGGMCARVCPTETLCEEACVREAAEGKPVRIGLLQRYATDALIETGPVALRARRADRQARGRRRRGPGGPRLRPCARGRGRRGHDLRGARQARRASTNTASPPTRRSTISPRRRPPSSCRSAGSRCSTASRSASMSTLEELRRDYDAVFLGMGLAGVNKLGLPGEPNSRTSSTPSTTSPSCVRRRTSPRCRSAGGSS